MSQNLKQMIMKHQERLNEIYSSFEYLQKSLKEYQNLDLFKGSRYKIQQEISEINKTLSTFKNQLDELEKSAINRATV